MYVACIETDRRIAAMWLQSGNDTSMWNDIAVWKLSACSCYYSLCNKNRFVVIGFLSCCHSDHWRRQLWGTGARAPPPSTSSYRSYFGDHSLYRLWRKCTKATQFLSIFGPFLSFFAHSFHQGVIMVPKMPERSPINFNSTRTSDSGKTGS